MVRIRCCRDSGRCHGSSHKCCHRQPCDLWEPACRRLQPPLLPGLLSLPWQLPQVLPPLLPRLLSLPWQLPQVLTSAAMPSVGAGMMATAPSAAARAHVAAMAAPTSADIGSHSICGSRHAGDCSLRCCQGSCRCPGSSHKCCHRQPFNLWEPACRRLHPPLLPRLLSLPWQLPQVLPPLLARLMSLPWQLPQVLPPLLPRLRSLPWQLPQVLPSPAVQFRAQNLGRKTDLREQPHHPRVATQRVEERVVARVDQARIAAGVGLEQALDR